MEQRQKNKEFEIKVNGDSAIILRCFSYGESAVIPREIDEMCIRDSMYSVKG